MVLKSMKTSDLAQMAAPYNPRTISDSDLQALRRSLKFFGTVEPIVWNRRSGCVVGGHQRIRAAQAEGIDTLPVVVVDLDNPSERQLNLALNRIQGQWDLEALSKVMHELEGLGSDLTLTGFSQKEIEEIFASTDPTAGLTDPDSIPDPLGKAKTRRDDLIELGRHRLLCGDAGLSRDVERLCGGLSMHLLNMDPPYNVRLEPRSNNAIISGSRFLPRLHHQAFAAERKPRLRATTTALRPKDRSLKGDFIDEEAFKAMLLAWFGNASAQLVAGRGFYIWGGYSNIKNYPAAISSAGLYFSQGIIWIKNVPVLTRKDFLGSHEWCFYGWKEGKAHYFNPSISNARDVWEVKKVSSQRMVHLTEKPVELAEMAMNYSSRKGENVLDLFGGSGSTLIAAERMDRKAFLMEIDPHYCDVIVKRWQDFTGEKAKGWRGHV